MSALAVVQPVAGVADDRSALDAAIDRVLEKGIDDFRFYAGRGSRGLGLYKLTRALMTAERLEVAAARTAVK